MSEALPPELNYTKLSQLPQNTVKNSVVIAPSNGSSFVEQGVIYFDMPASGFLIPDTLYLRYKWNCTNATSTCGVRGIPACSTFSRIDTIIGSNTAQTIPFYGQLMNMLYKLKQTVTQKWGSPNLGIGDVTGTNGTIASLVNMNGKLIPFGSTYAYSYAFPLLNIFSQAEKLVPLCMMPGCRIALTVDTLANYITASSTITGFSLTNLELCYDQVNFGADVEQQIRASNEVITIKSASYGLSSQPVAVGFQGIQDLVYQFRYSSIRSLFTMYTPNTSATKATNQSYDSLDITSVNGTYQYFVNSVGYPNKALDALANKSGILLELRSAVEGLHSAQSNLSITPQEWNANDAFVYNTVSTTQYIPGSFYTGANLEKIVGSGHNTLLSGISSKEAPVILRLNCNTATSFGYTVICVALVDALIQVNVGLRDVTVIV